MNITKVLQQLREKNSVPSQIINQFQNSLDGNLKTLNDNDDLRTFDGKNGGALRGPVSSRNRLEKRKKDGCVSALNCQEAYLKYKKGPTEVAYFRAVFNSNDIVFKTKDRDLLIISYEAPLMRKKSKEKTPKISGRKVSCDLVALASRGNRLICIEGKIDPKGYNTSLPYALLEAFAYGYCLDYHLKHFKKELIKEIKLCVKTFHNEEINIPNDLTGEYAIAAPKEYYDEYRRAITGKESILTKKFSCKRLKEAQIIERTLINISRPSFAGYFSLRPSAVRENFEVCSQKKDHKGNRIITPYFEKGLKSAKCFANLKDLGMF